MKCVHCGSISQEGKLLCQKCMKESEWYSQFVKSHTCNSFMPKEGGANVVCKNAISCQPMKKALQEQQLINSQMGHVVCPYPEMNISHLIYNKFSKETLERNYKEYLD